MLTVKASLSEEEEILARNLVDPPTPAKYIALSKLMVLLNKPILAAQSFLYAHTLYQKENSGTGIENSSAFYFEVNAALADYGYDIQEFLAEENKIISPGLSSGVAALYKYRFNINIPHHVLNEIVKYLDLTSLQNLRLVNKFVLTAVTHSFQTVIPYRDSLSFTFATAGYFTLDHGPTNRDFAHHEGKIIYFRTILNYQSTEPAIFYKLKDLEELKANGTFAEFAAGENPYTNGRVYCPNDKDGKNKHLLSTNLIWVLSLLHTRIPVSVYKELSPNAIVRTKDEAQASAFAYEVVGTQVGGYDIKINLDASYYFQLVPPLLSKPVTIQEIRQLNHARIIKEAKKVSQQVNNMRTFFIEWEEILKKYLQAKKINPQANFLQLTDRERDIAALDPTICTLFIIKKLLSNIRGKEMPAALNAIYNLVRQQNECDNKIVKQINFLLTRWNIIYSWRDCLLPSYLQNIFKKIKLEHLSKQLAYVQAEKLNKTTKPNFSYHNNNFFSSNSAVKPIVITTIDKKSDEELMRSVTECNRSTGKNF